MKVYKNKKGEIGILKTYDELLEMWDTDYEELDVKTLYGTTHVIVSGKSDGKPLVLFHGVGDDSALMWVYNAKELGKYYRLYAIDTIGGPGKSRPNENYNKDFDDVTWIDETFNGLNLTYVDVAGVSNGGYLSQLYLLNRPQRVNKAINISSCVPAGELGSPLKRVMKIFLPEALFPTKKNATKLMKKLCGKNYRVFTENDTIMQHYTYLLKGFNNMAMGFHKVKGFTDEQIDSIREKAFYIIGEDDPFALLGGKEALKKYHMNVHYFKDAGHGVNHEMAETVNDLIRNLLDEAAVSKN